MKIYLLAIYFVFYLKYGYGENLKLLILHNNDMHSRFEETSRTSGTCKDKTNCYGGFARVLHVIREARKAAADGTGPPVLYLNAGDTYTGTSWFSVHKWKIAADFLNLLHPDVASATLNDNQVTELLKMCLQKVCELQQDLKRSIDSESNPEAAGYAACATETLRFLTAEGVPADHPFVKEMQELFTRNRRV